MNILQITRTFTPAVGGIENVTAGLSAALVAKGHRCDVLTLSYIFDRQIQAMPVETVDSLTVYRIPHLGGRRYPIAPAVLSFVPYYDVLHIHAIDFFIDYLSLTYPQHRRPIVVNTHGGIFHTRWLAPLKRLWFNTITRLSLRQAAAVICDSQHDHDLFHAIVPAERLHIIRNGVNITPFRAIQKNIQPGLLLGIGRVVENKRIEYLIELLPELIRIAPHTRLVWIGDVTTQRRTWLLNRAAELGVAEQVTLAGLTSPKELLDYLARAHAFVSVSAFEAFGVSTIEAMASSTVPVVTSVGIHPEVVHHSRTGFRLDGNDRGADIQVLAQVLRLDPSALDQIGANARKEVQPFAWEHVCAQYESVYKRTCRTM
jgi:alpha-1,3-mannosyltransferase